MNTLAGKTGTPALLLFMVLGMVFGSDGIFKIPFDNYELMQQVSTIALVFIIFYGGFSTKWKTAKPIVKQAAVLSTAGVLLTAVLTCIFCHYVLKISFAESFVIGAVISSTDAASVFAILRSKKLNLKYSSAPILELESGSNDPFSYMLTIIGIAILTGKDIGFIPVLFAKQFIIGILSGVIVAYTGILLLNKTRIISENIYSLFITAVMIFSFSLSDITGGNGLLSVYISGIIMGNSNIKNINLLVGFFDGITAFAQVTIFFLLGLTSFPHKIPEIILPASAIALFLTFVARPAAVFGLLMPFKAPANQCLLISWAGLRGAASVVFAVLVAANVPSVSKYYLFHVVFLISILSVTFQGTLLPLIAKITNMIDNNSDVRKTFNDFQEKSAFSLIKIFITNSHEWNGKTVKEISLPQEILILTINRNDKKIIARGNTLIQTGDYVILSMPAFKFDDDDVNIKEVEISASHEWCNKNLLEIRTDENQLVAMIIRRGSTIIPKGSTKIEENDILVIIQQKN